MLDQTAATAVPLDVQIRELKNEIAYIKFTLVGKPKFDHGDSVLYTDKGTGKKHEAHIYNINIGERYELGFEWRYEIKFDGIPVNAYLKDVREDSLELIPKE